MNGERQHITKIWDLPAKITLHFDGFDGAPERKDLRPILTYENQERCLAQLKVVEYDEKRVVIALPDSLRKFGNFRYQVHLYQSCCRPCDTAVIEFCGECDITRTSVEYNV